MIAVTTEAKEVLQGILQQTGVDDEDTAVRLTRGQDESTGQTQLGLVLDQERPGDQVVEHNNRKVLLVDETMATQLDGVTLGAVDTPEGRRLSVTS